MEVVSLSKLGIQSCVTQAAKTLSRGGVIVYPTDTLYGLGAHAFSDEAVEKIYTIKGREEGKPIHAIVADLEMANHYGEIDDRVRMLAERLPKGKITFVVRKKTNVMGGIASGIDTFGFRIPDDDFCQALLSAYGGPITATSANRSGVAPDSSVQKILEQLGDDACAINLVIDAGELPFREPSTVIDLSGERLRVLREGVIPTPDALKGFIEP